MPWRTSTLASHSTEGKLEEAVAEYREAIRLKPGDARAHGNLGVALSEQGKRDEALAEHRETIRLEPNFAAGHNNLAWVLASQLDPKHRDPTEALAHARKAVELEPQEGDYFNTLGFVEYRSGNLDAARTALDRQ